MSLPFSTEARRQFDPVAQQFGFSLRGLYRVGLRYESDKVFLKLISTTTGHTVGCRNWT